MEQMVQTLRLLRWGVVVLMVLRMVGKAVECTLLLGGGLQEQMPYLAQYCAGLMSLSVQDDARVVLALMEEVGDDDVFPLLEVEGYVAFH